MRAGRGPARRGAPDAPESGGGARLEDGNEDPPDGRRDGRAREPRARHRRGPRRAGERDALRRREGAGRGAGRPARGDPDPLREGLGLPRRAPFARLRAVPPRPRPRDGSRRPAILLRFRPDVIVGTGGFASAPVIFAATFLKKLRLSKARVFVHEQNAVPGKLNRLVGRFAEKVFVTFPETLSLFPGNGALTGYPVRKRIGHVAPEEARARLDFAVPEGRTVVFVFGGSQGSRSLNRGLVDALGDLMPHADRLFVVHGTGLFKGGGLRRGGRHRGAPRDALHGRGAARGSRRSTCRGATSTTSPRSTPWPTSSSSAAARGASTRWRGWGSPPSSSRRRTSPATTRSPTPAPSSGPAGRRSSTRRRSSRTGTSSRSLDGARLARRILALAEDPERRADMSKKGRDVLGIDAAAEIAHHVRARPRARRRSTRRSSRRPRSSRTPRSSSRLEKAAAAAGRSYRVEDVVEPRDLAWFRSRAASLLVNDEWEARNLGVKLLGLLDATDKVPLLLALLADRTPAPLLQRLLGGDFAQVGFVRRNVFTALARLDVVDAGVEEAAPRRASPTRTGRCGRRRRGRPPASPAGSTRRAEVVAALGKGLSDRNLEAAAAAAEALGALGGEKDALPALLALADYRFWKVRAAALQGRPRPRRAGRGARPGEAESRRSRRSSSPRPTSAPSSR